eukprot:CAMPEP_0197660344 /NCGR_PEP_ID=MMETSP1338-20131121/50790_1 /TAXON_ID=43686 ORGANISM="Pelagodinium beii, Strain RCC1491" /NCGR_SAMPLE_ID=MMETSP1338 /ASSEMBLY_ACC=CAM_ASM_000754 /LENGTH=447 /DNA_ID=CAMNT_0043237677 /DNA_START=66 /DNA_END=1409 /DNA_ORIENTATION=+
MAWLRVALLLHLVLGVSGHGMLLKPMARQMVIGDYDNGVGLTDPGAGLCGITEGNGMNMNGCQGGCAWRQFPNCDGPDMSGWQPYPRVGVCGGLATEDVMAVVNPVGEGCENVGDGDKSCVKQALSSAKMSILEVDSSGYFLLDVRITAHHWGWFEFRLCTQGEGLGPDGKGVTQDCFNDHVLTFDAADAAQRYPQSKMADDSRPGCFWPYDDVACKNLSNPSDYQRMEPSTRCDGQGTCTTYEEAVKAAQAASKKPSLAQFERAPCPDCTGNAALGKTDMDLKSPGGSCCLDGGDCGDSASNPNQNIRWVLPRIDAAVPDPNGTSTDVPNAEPMNGIYIIKLKLPEDAMTICNTKVCTLQWLYMTGNSPSAYPEAFRNCADFKITPSAGPVALAETVQHRNYQKAQHRKQPRARSLRRSSGDGDESVQMQMPWPNSVEPMKDTMEL